MWSAHALDRQRSKCQLTRQRSLSLWWHYVPKVVEQSIRGYPCWNQMLSIYHWQEQVVYLLCYWMCWQWLLCLVFLWAITKMILAIGGCHCWFVVGRYILQWQDYWRKEKTSDVTTTISSKMNLVCVYEYPICYFIKNTEI